MNREELEERQLEIANRMKNIIWTVCGDYTLEAKPDVEAFLKSKYIALYLSLIHIWGREHFVGV